MNALLLITLTLTFIPLLTWSLCYVGDWHTRLGHCKGMFWCFDAAKQTSLFLFSCYHVMRCGSYVWLYALFSLPQVSFQLVSMVRNHPSCLSKNFSKQMMNFKFTVWDIYVQTDYEKKTNCNVLCMFSLKISNLHCKLELDSLIMCLLVNSVWNPDFCAISTNACTTATIYWPPAMWFIHYPHVYVPFKITPCFVHCTIPIFCWVFTLYIQNKLI